MAKYVALIALSLIASGCGRSATEELTQLSEEFVDTTLAFSPSAATAAGLHTLRKLNLDEMLDDMSPANLDRQRQFYEDFNDRLSKLNTGKLTPEDRADVLILQNQCALAILDLSEVQSYLHNPTVYVEILGNALFTPFTLEYAPKPDRIRSILARLQKVPLLLNQASTNLTSAPLVWTQLAMEENQGNIDLVDRTMRAAVPADGPCAPPFPPTHAMSTLAPPCRP
ncbi:conserved exported hypothetical protein [Candidatus Sulfopaludibacter sp. SbA3]|nr:conserved exported hypothetical protein [Candidatus Sulfopaludibacter sp. SbA3]